MSHLFRAYNEMDEELYRVGEKLLNDKIAEQEAAHLLERLGRPQHVRPKAKLGSQAVNDVNGHRVAPEHKQPSAGTDGDSKMDSRVDLQHERTSADTLANIVADGQAHGLQQMTHEEL